MLNPGMIQKCGLCIDDRTDLGLGKCEEQQQQSLDFPVEWEPESFKSAAVLSRDKNHVPANGPFKQVLSSNESSNNGPVDTQPLDLLLVFC